MASNKEKARARDEGDADSSLADQTPGDGVPRDRLGRRRGRQVKRVDTLEAERRTEWFRKAIVEGWSTADIVAAVAKQKDEEFAKLSRRQIFRYLAAALDDVRNSAKIDRTLELGKAIARNETIIRRALNPPVNDKGKPLYDMDLRTAQRANQANARLMGIEPPVRLRHGGDPDSPPLEAGGNFVVLVQEVVEG